MTITVNSNPEIPGFGFAQSRDFGIEKRSGIWDPGIAIPRPTPLKSLWLLRLFAYLLLTSASAWLVIDHCGLAGYHHATASCCVAHVPLSASQKKTI